MGGILVIGSMNVDFAARVTHTPRQGETMLASDMAVHAGGKGGNQAYAAAKLGASVVMLGAVGADEHGALLTRSLESVGVDVSHIKRDKDLHTGMAWIAVTERGDNSIIVIPGANRAVDRAYIDAHIDAIRACDTVVLQLEIPLDTVLYAAKTAKALGKRVILDPAPAVSNISAELLACADIVKPNETELATLVSNPSASSCLRDAALQLQKRGAQNVLVTLGGDGVYLLCRDGTEKRFAARAVRVVDTTAAGDSFTAALALKLSQGESLENAVSFAMRVSEIVVSRPGAQDSIPDADEVPS